MSETGPVDDLKAVPGAVEARGTGRDAARAQGEGGGAQLDVAIDHAVSQMLGVEPPPGLRGRVLDRIELRDPMASAFRRKFWLAAPLATAALILAVLAPWREAAPPLPSSTAPPPAAAANTDPPPGTAPVGPGTRETGITRPTPKAAPRAAASVERPRAPARPPPRIGEIVAVVAPEDTNFATVGALASPESIAVERVAAPPAPSIPAIDPVPLQIRALELTALPETPRERRED